ILEVSLSDAFFKYAQHLFYGKVDPKKLYSLWGVKRKQLDLQPLLEKASDKKTILEILDSLKPDHPVYVGLKKSLQEYEELKKQDSTITRIEEGKLLQPGKSDQRVPQLAKRLQELG